MQMNDPIRVISDLHLGHPACRVQSVEQLSPLFQGAGTIVFNGDTVEQRSPELAEKSASILAELKQLLANENIHPVFLRGNHDPHISTIDYLELPEHKTMITHGDCLYRKISPWNPKIWKLEADFAKLAEQMLPSKSSGQHADFQTLLNYTQQCRLIAKGDESKKLLSGRWNKLHSAGRLIYPPRRPIEIVRCWSQHRKRIDEFQQRYAPLCDYVLVGHIHRNGIHRLGKPSAGKYGINTGGFLSFGNALMVEFNHNENVSVFAIDESGVDFQIGKRVRFS